MVLIVVLTTSLKIANYDVITDAVAAVGSQVDPSYKHTLLMLHVPISSSADGFQNERH